MLQYVIQFASNTLYSINFTQNFDRQPPILFNQLLPLRGDFRAFVLSTSMRSELIQPCFPDVTWLFIRVPIYSCSHNNSSEIFPYAKLTNIKHGVKGIISDSWEDRPIYPTERRITWKSGNIGEGG